MARGRARWKKAIDPKPYLTLFMQRMEEKLPPVTKFLRYHGTGSGLEHSEIFERFTRAHSFKDGIYLDAYKVLSINNVDSPARNVGQDITWLESAIIDGGFMHGHALFPVRLDGKLVGGSVGWGFAYPMPKLHKTERLPGVSVAIPSIKNYYHLLLDHLMPAVCSIIRNPARFNQQINFVSNQPIHAVNFFVGILNELGFNARCIVIKKAQSALCDKILHAKAFASSVEHTYAFQAEMRMLREIIDRKIICIRTPDRVYIPRTQTRIRNIENQKDVERFLASRGFVPFPFSWGNFLDQVAVFRRAELVVSAHGAALTNLMFGDGGSVVEIHSANARKTTYLHIASQHGWTYTPVLGEEERKKQNFIIDLDVLSDGLRK